MEELKSNSNTSQLKQKLSDDVFGIAKDSRLAESYNEKSRRGQSFEADLSKYDTKQQEVVKKATESGILNNSNRTHEFVDMLARISADKGVSFDFTNNDKLKNSIFAVEGSTVNGYVTANGITLNIDSAKALNSVVGHEITHILERTELYNSLQQTIIKYAKSKGDYQSRYDTLSKLYEGIEDANVDNELTADLVGDYLFTDSEFINSLSTEQPNLFKRIYNEIKYLYKVATAGSKEARELEKVKRVFDKAYKESVKAQKNTTDNGDVKYMLSKDTEGNTFVDVTEDIFDINDGESVAQVIRKVISKKYNNLINVNGQNIQINKTTNDEFRRSNSAVHFIMDSSQAYTDKLKTIANADEILYAARNWIGEKLKHERKDDIVEFARANVMYRVGENGYVADVLVGIRENGATVLYDLVNIYGKEITEASVTMASDKIDSQRRQNASVNNVLLQNSSNVNTKSSKTVTDYSLDSEGNKITTDNPDIRYSLSIETEKVYNEAVKNNDIATAQKIVDDVAKENGYTIKAYHGTLAKNFTEFKKDLIGSRFSFDEKGFFFIDRKSIAEDYASSEFDSNKYGRVLEVYLKSKNPLIVDSDFALKNGLGKIYRDNDVIDVWDNYCTYLLEEAEESNADAIILNDGMSKMTVVFEPNQIKSAEPITYDDNGNVIPLSQRFNADNNDIRYSYSKEDKTPNKYGNFNIYGKDIKYQGTEDVAPVQKNVAEREKTAPVQTVNNASTETFYPDDYAPLTEEAVELKIMQAYNHETTAPEKRKARCGVRLPPSPPQHPKGCF